jgi:hypothetical protein
MYAHFRRATSSQGADKKNRIEATPFDAIGLLLLLLLRMAFLSNEVRGEGFTSVFSLSALGRK